MGRRSRFLGTFAALSALPLAWASAQVRSGVPVQPVPPTYAPPAYVPPPAAVEPQPPAVVPTPPVVLPPPMWDPRDAQALLGFIQQIGTEGLSPVDYDPDGLIVALRSANPMLLAQAATDRFNRLSSDLAFGHVRGDDRQDWHIPDPDLDSNQQAVLLQVALAQHRVPDALRGLLPSHPQYAALRHALEVTPATETAKINRIRLNMDRWRWLPRDLGERYIIVNVPAYTAALVEDGVTTSRHHAVAGKISTPTPQLSAVATGVILNPWWEVPKSIEGEVRGKAGYVPFKDDKGKILRWRQPPGPKNALGQLKFVMPNSKAIYLHDTNARSKFNSQVRAFSHGCIRTEHILALATKLLNEGATIDGTPGGVEWTPDKISAALASEKTVQANFPKPLPVYIVYMSSAALVDGTIKDYTDVYKRDGKVIAALLDQKPATKPAAPAKDVASR
ncbi:MAG: L,D-transpeptidase family protein [Sphingomicrobium sp.]